MQTPIPSTMPTELVDLEMQGDQTEAAPTSEVPESEGQTEEKKIATVSSVGTPALLWLRLVGIYVLEPLKVSGKVESSESKRESKISVLGVFWCLLVNVAYVLNAGRYSYLTAVSWRSLEESVPEFTVAHMSTLVALYNLALIRSYRRIPALIEKFDTYFSKFGQAPAITKWLWLYRVQFLIYPLWATVTSTGTIIFYAEHSMLMRWVITPFENTTGTPRIVAIAATSVLQFLVGTVLAFQWSIFSMFAWMLKKEFARFNKAAETYLTGKVESESLERQRFHLERLCSLVEDTNSLFSHFLAQTYLLGYPLVLVIAYGFARHSYSVEEVFFLFLVAWMAFATAASTTVHSAIVNSKAHESRVYLLKTKLDNLSEKTVQIINLFVARLSGPSIGFSVYGLFTIDMPAILTLLGTLIAYVVVVLQFQPSSPSCDCPSSPPLTTALPLNWSLTTP